MTKQQIDKAMQCLIDNGIDPDEYDDEDDEDDEDKLDDGVPLN